MKNKVEMGKQYKSSEPAGLFDGIAFRRVLAVDCIGKYPVAIEFENGEILRYTEDGYWRVDNLNNSYNLIEVTPYDDFKTDDKVMVSMSGTDWYKRHFDKEVYGMACCFNEGRTSWTQGGSCLWSFCRRPTEEELKEIRNEQVLYRA